MFNISRIIKWKDLLFILPCLIGVAIFYLYPCGILLVEVFGKNGLEGSCLEFKNLLKSEAFILSIKNMCIFIGILLPLLLVFSLSVAASIQYLFKMKYKMVHLIFLLHLVPMIIPSTVIAVALEPLLANDGAFNVLLSALGCGSIDFFYSEFCIIILGFIFIWKNYGYIAVVLYGGMNAIPEEVIESAKIDGADSLRIFLKIILPQIKGFLSYTICLGIIGVFKSFRESYLLFGKYPYDSVYMFQNFINNNLYSMNYGRLTTASLLLIVFFIIFIYFMLLRNKENE